MWGGHAPEHVEARVSVDRSVATTGPCRAPTPLPGVRVGAIHRENCHRHHEWSDEMEPHRLGSFARR